MYESTQHFLTLTIETVVILGYGGLIVHYIATLSTSKQMNFSEKQEAEITPKFVPIVNEITEVPTIDEYVTSDKPIAEHRLTSLLQIKTEFPSNIQLDTDPLNLPFIQVDSLTLRQCRTVIRALNSTLPKSDRIRLKLNKKDAPTDWLKAQIKKQLENQPQQVSPIIEDVLKVG